MSNIKQMFEDINKTTPAYPIIWLPIGTIYENKFDISEEINNYFVGTWERYGNGEVLVGVNENDEDFSVSDKSIGEKKHTLTVNEMPSHNHSGTSGDWGSSSSGIYGVMTNKAGLGAGVSTNYTGGGQSHNNIQPSRTVYRWIRVS